MNNLVVIEIDGYYLYWLGGQIHPVFNIQGGSSFEQWKITCLAAQHALEEFYTKSLYWPKISLQAADRLHAILEELNEEQPDTISDDKALTIRIALNNFEAVLTAEFKTMSIFYVKQQRGYVTKDLIYNGKILFPSDLEQKVPCAIVDIMAAARCIAFALPTSAGFHLLRATEAVMREYWNIVTDGAAQPRQKNMGVFLKQMDEKGVGDSKVKAALRDIKDFYRNPLLHPEENLESLDDAIGLLGSVQAVIVKMLAEIPNKTQPTHDQEDDHSANSSTTS